MMDMIFTKNNVGSNFHYMNMYITALLGVLYIVLYIERSNKKTALISYDHHIS